MSKKHYFPSSSANTLVPLYLSSLTTANPHLSLIPGQKVVVNNQHNPQNVSLISGGGSGHEPSWSGYVGNGLLSASACGDIFASPTTMQILHAISAVPSKKGTILLITNYTGDKLHFGLAAERALEGGMVDKCEVVSAMDDVAIGRSECGRVGRRGLAGNGLTMKILGAAAEKGYEFGRCVKIGRAVGGQMVSIGSALDHCHVPGRKGNEEMEIEMGLGDEEVYIGAGIHNEPGAQKLRPFPTVEDLIGRLLGMLCSQEDPERAFVKFEKGDEVALLMNNYGGLSNLELGALTQETLIQLETNWNIKPVKIYCGVFETSLNGPGFSITLCNLTATTKGCEVELSVGELMDLLGAETNAPSWPNVLANTSTKEERKKVEVDLGKELHISPDDDVIVDHRKLERVVRVACSRAIKAEPDLTKWDMVMGDGDCGEGVKSVSQAILKILDDGKAKSGSVLTFLHAVINAVDEMGGTLGGIMGILLAAFTHALRTVEKDPKNSSLVDVCAPSLTQAVETLKKYTGARVGDRTVMDVLLPFAETLEKERSFGKAVGVAERAAEGTRDLKPKFGRASYVHEGGEEQRVPDPGAWAFKEIVKGIYEASK